MLRRNSGKKAQSAMEYLMTYGWAILIMAVVLGALFGLGVFSGSNLIGTSCIAAPGYLCTNPSLLTNGQLSITFGQNTGYPIYNVELACSATTSSAGLPSSVFAWNVINSQGTPTGYPGTDNAGNTPYYGNALVQNAISMVSGQTINIVGLPCYSATAVPLGVPNAAAIGTPFSGFIWLNYTTSPCTGGAEVLKCTWSTVKAATVSVKVV